MITRDKVAVTVCLLIILASVVVLSQQLPQTPRPTANVEDLFNRIGRDQIEMDFKEKYINMLEAQVRGLQAQVEACKPKTEEVIPPAKGASLD